MARSTEQLVDRQLQRWAQESRAARPRRPSPCIALSRLPGAGGAALGLRLADRLGFGFFGKELVEEVAREQGIALRLVANLDEHVRNTIERNVGDAFRRQPLLESDYLRALVHTITAIGERGGAVLLGRGAPFVLSPERTLRVLVVAPADVRAERLAKARKLDAGEAVRELAREDSERVAFARHHFRQEPDDPSRYDLVVNTGTLSIEAAADVVIVALERRFPTPD